MENLSEKITTLQKNFYDLNSLFELSIIATQADSIEDLIEKVTEFITQGLNISDVRFFINHDRVYYMVATSSNETQEYFQFENDDEGFWEEERLYQSDLLISVTDNDELNIIAASYAKRMGTKRAVSLIKTNNSYIALAEAMDIDGVISTTNATVDAIVRYLRSDRIQSLHTLFDGQLEVYEYEVTDGFMHVGHKLRDIDFKGKLTIAGVKRAGGKDNFIPDGNYRIEPGDTLLISATHANYAYAEKVLTSSM